MKVGIFYFIENTEKSIQQLKLSLYFLFKNYNAKYHHEVTLFYNDEKIDKKDEVLMGIRTECKHLIKFVKLSPTLFNLTEEQKKYVDRSVESKIKSDWGNIQDRLLNRFWSIQIWDIVKDYDYIMKLDTDVIIEEPMSECFFKIMNTKDYNYLSNHLILDCDLGSYGFHDYIKAKFPDVVTDSMFSESKITDKATLTLFKKFYDNDYTKDEIKCYQPISYDDCFFVTKVSFWQDSKITEILKEIDHTNNIFKYKWTSATILSFLSMMIEKSKIVRCVFRMSKEDQREAVEVEGMMTSLVPEKYSQSGCITSK